MELGGPQGGLGATLNNATNYLKLLFHSLACHAPTVDCKLPGRCGMGKELLAHQWRCSDRHCQDPYCDPMSKLLQHYCYCNDMRCELCSAVWHDPTAAADGPSEDATAYNIASGRGAMTQAAVSCHLQPAYQHDGARGGGDPQPSGDGNGEETASGDDAMSVATLPLAQAAAVEFTRWLIYSLVRGLRRSGPQVSPEQEALFEQGRQLLGHMVTCRDPDCTTRRCRSSKKLMLHMSLCQAHGCPLCAPISQFFLSDDGHVPGPVADIDSAVQALSASILHLSL